MTSTDPLKVLVVDDTALYRKIVADVLAELPDVQVVGTALNGKMALSKIAALQPDLLTLDVEMPEMNGLEVLEQLQRQRLPVGALMLSTLTTQGGDMTVKALELGAFDFIPKPQDGSLAANKLAIKTAIGPMLKAFARQREIKKLLRGAPAALPRSAPVVAPTTRKTTGETVRPGRAEIIGIGVSTGGPNALARMLPTIPADIGVPIVIVQHMPPVFTQSLAKSLNAKCAIEVREAVDGEPLVPNTALIAPGGKQMKVVASNDGRNRIVRINEDPPENSCRPSVDYLFRSLASLYVGRATGVIMTGMGSDGAKGLTLMKQNGAHVIAQDEATCVVYGMPKAPTDAGIVDTVAPLERIGEEIVRTVKKAG